MSAEELYYATKAGISLFRVGSTGYDAYMRHCDHCDGKRHHCTCSLGCPVASKNNCTPFHNGIQCDSCRMPNIIGTRYNCQVCPNFDLCSTCYNSISHFGERHNFFAFARAACQPTMMAPKQSGSSSSSSLGGSQSSMGSVPSLVPSPGSSASSFPVSPSTIRPTSSSSTGSMPPNINTSSTNSHASSFLGSASSPPYLPPSHVVNNLQLPGAMVVHSGVHCDGPSCPLNGNCIAGPRYNCAECPPSVDLCQDCYTSECAHDPTHSFKRFDSPVSISEGHMLFVLCPPQVKMRNVVHKGVFCDGLYCKLRDTFIVGPRYCCADCPPSVDLCQDCYLSKTSHDPTHSFHRFEVPEFNGSRVQGSAPQVERIRSVHIDVFCDGPRCKAGHTFITGSRFRCADCPPSVDLCQDCYQSATAHDPTHSFHRFDIPESDAKVMRKKPILCAPQVERRHSVHIGVFCGGFHCKSSGTFIKGPRYCCADCSPSVDLCQECYYSEKAHDPTHAFRRFDQPNGYGAFSMCPPQKLEVDPVHDGVICDGPYCRIPAGSYITGRRYCCAECHPGVDLCEDCYESRVAHDPTHAFKRFNKPSLKGIGYNLCPPQQFPGGQSGCRPQPPMRTNFLPPNQPLATHNPPRSSHHRLQQGQTGNQANQRIRPSSVLARPPPRPAPIPHYQNFNQQTLNRPGQSSRPPQHHSLLNSSNIGVRPPNHYSISEVQQTLNRPHSEETNLLEQFKTNLESYQEAREERIVEEELSRLQEENAAYLAQLQQQHFTMLEQEEAEGEVGGFQNEGEVGGFQNEGYVGLCEGGEDVGDFDDFDFEC